MLVTPKARVIERIVWETPLKFVNVVVTLKPIVKDFVSPAPICTSTALLIPFIAVKDPKTPTTTRAAKVEPIRLRSVWNAKALRASAKATMPSVLSDGVAATVGEVTIVTLDVWAEATIDAKRSELRS